MKKIFPRISTRGFYDLYSGRTIENEPYRLYPKRDFEALIDSRGDYYYDTWFEK